MYSSHLTSLSATLSDKGLVRFASGGRKAMNFYQRQVLRAKSAGRLALLRHSIAAAAVLMLAVALDVSAAAQTAAPPPSSAPAAPAASGATQGGAEATTTFSGSDENLSPEQLESLVSRIALYPDDLLALVLPASTQPVQIVQAQRLLDQRKTDPNAQPPKSWDPSVVGLLNYPEVIQLMNADLTWTEQLGTSVINQQAGVLDAIQVFRQKVAKAGNLKSDEHQKVSETEQKIVIESAKPDVVYVPQYNTTTIVNPPAPGYPPPYYYSPPYPYYYSPAATFFTGAMFGAAIGYAIGWNNGGIYSGDVNVNRNVNVSDVGNRTSNVQRSNRSNSITRNPENSWKPDRNSVSRGQAQRGGGAGAATRPTSGQIQSGLANRGGAQGGGGLANQGRGQTGGGFQNRGGAQGGNLAAGGRGQGGGEFQNRGGGGGQVGNAQRGGAFSGANRGGANAVRASNRGNQSLSGGRGGGGGGRSGGGGRGGGGGGGRRR
jgi:Protein of unknown function (DUF3300)